MTDYGMSIELATDIATARERVEAALAEQGFGVLTEIDVAATMKIIEDKKIVERLFVSCYGGAFDIGNDKVWDTWQIEGPDMVWHFRGVPHIHGYFHLAA